MNTFLAEALPFPRVAALARGGAVALLPVGSTEAHGPHLPLSVDVKIAQAVCERVARKLNEATSDVVVFPPLAYALTEFARPFAGTVSLSRATALAMTTEVLGGIAEHGFSRIGVINHHLEPEHFRVMKEAGRAAARPSCRVVVVDHRKAPTGPSLGHEFMHGGSHAGTYETALMLAVAPSLVDERQRLALKPNPVDLPARIKAGATNFHECGGPEAYFGDPANATVAEGERLLALLVQHAFSEIANPEI